MDEQAAVEHKQVLADVDGGVLVIECCPVGSVDAVLEAGFEL